MNRKHELGYVCEHCGYEGRDIRPVDELECPRCGEAVVPSA